MLYLLDEINSCLNQNLPYAALALALALMVPDVGANVEFPKITKKW